MIAAGSFTVWAECIILIFLRVLSAFVLSPVFGKSVPNVAKIVISIAISYIVILTIDPMSAPVYNTVTEFIAACAKEILLGLIFGFIVLLFLSTVYAAGQLIDIQLGFSFATLYSSEFNAQTPLTGTFFNIIIIIIFFMVDAHHDLFRLIFMTFDAVPPGSFVFTADFVRLIIEMFSLAFTISVKIAMPVIIVSLATEVLLGVVMKVVPQMNFFVIGFPIKIFLGVIILLTFIPSFVNVYEGVFNNIFEGIQKVFEGLS